ncbi:MAG: PAS domain S-box protein [Deltaproteobacteria bacterium]|nr:PAS domain S-box protein [Deltaproteobacteria bacterium]
MQICNMKIVIIDDEQSSLDLVRKRLEGSGYTCIRAFSSSREGFDYVVEEQPDLVLLDLVMPEMDGYEFCSRLRSQASLPFIPIIIITGGSLDSNKVIEQAFAAGATDFITKPIQPIDLVVRVKSALTLKQTFDSLNSEIAVRKKAEQNLRESEERFRNIAETTPDAIVAVDADQEIVYWNKSAETMFGYSPDEILGKEVQVLIPERFRKRDSAGVKRLIESGLSNAINKTIEGCGLHKNGTEFSFEVSRSVCKKAGAFTMYAICRDITQRKQAEEEHVRQEKLSSILEMSGAVCHELNQPLQGIMGAAELLMWQIEEQAPYYEKVKKIQELTQHMGSITQRLLHITTYETKSYLDGQIIDLEKAAPKKP